MGKVLITKDGKKIAGQSVNSKTTGQLVLLDVGEDNEFSPLLDESLLANDSPEQKEEIKNINALDDIYSEKFSDIIEVRPSFSRKIVSFQENKNRSAYRWYKYKEAFSASLIEQVLEDYGISEGIALDPFAGSGTALFSASAAGLNADGIELLPIGHEIINSRICVEKDFSDSDFSQIENWIKNKPWTNHKISFNIKELRITKGAYPDPTSTSIEKYMSAIKDENKKVQQVLRFALLCVLESVSYTRKDGQYLRWDYRSGRKQGKKTFDKGTISGFDSAICEKLSDIIRDVRGKSTNELFEKPRRASGDIKIISGSCLEILPTMKALSYDVVITSPPYCNRYDYTRTYALELALLGVNEMELSALRQNMLSCTVENRAKDLLSMNSRYLAALEAANGQELLQSILTYLEAQKERKYLNNNGIPRMVKGYFYEMACVIFECFRVMKHGARLFMVNDNVRYAGASVSVDLILSDIAKKLGFEIEHIFVLPNGKGNSSQQMGEHGRAPLRKCVYVWRKGTL